MSSKEAVLCFSRKLIYVSARINNKPVKALLDTGASISVINESLVEKNCVYRGEKTVVHDFVDQPHEFSSYCCMNVRCGSYERKIKFLVIPKTPFDILLSRPTQKQFEFNLMFDDTISMGRDQIKVKNIEVNTCNRVIKKGKSFLNVIDDIKDSFPSLVSSTGYPSVIKFMKVHFKLSSMKVVSRKPYQISRAKAEWLENEIAILKKNGVIRDSTSPYASPVLLVPKGMSWRMCTDYRMINEQTELLSWPLPRIDDIIAETGGCKVFTTIDLLKGFWQIPLSEETKQFTAFVTHSGSYEYNVLPFGWKNSPKYFQQMMDRVLKEHKKFCRYYIDDILIFSRSKEEHQNHLHVVLSALENAGLKVNLEKIEICKDKVTFLGRTIDGRTKTTKEESIQKVKDIKEPTNVKSLQRFLGLCGHFRQFIKDYSKLSKSLTSLLKNDVKFAWGKDQQEAFNALKAIITSNPVLTLPDFSKPFILTTDASDIGTGAVLTQKDDGNKEHVIAFHSYTLTQAEGNYSTTEKEMLAVIKASKYFKTFLDDNKFILQTDHSALKELLSCKEPKGRIARWVNYLQSLDFTIIHRPGISIPHADAMSRLPQEAERIMSFRMHDDRRLFVPPDKRMKILEIYHDSMHSGGHDGTMRTFRKISQRFFWPSMRKSIYTYVRTCDTCQRNKAKFKAKPDKMIIREIPKNPMEVIHLDFAEKCKKSDTKAQTQSFLVAIDRKSRFAAAKVGKENSQSVIDLLSQKLFENTKVIITDKAKVFESKQLKEWADRRGIVINTGSPYNPQSNGLAERLIRDLKMFMSMYPDCPGGWKKCLEAAVRHHNRSFCIPIGCTPTFVLKSELPYLPADDMLNIKNSINLKEKVSTDEEQLRNKMEQKRNFDRRHPSHPVDMKLNDMVLVRRGLARQFQKFVGPVKVTGIERFNNVIKRIQYDDQGVSKTSAIRNVVKYCPRSDRA